MSADRATTDYYLSGLVEHLVYRLAAEHAEFIAELCGFEIDDTDQAEALLHNVLELVFHPFEVAAATDTEVCAYLTSVLKFVFINKEAAFYRPPGSKEKPVSSTPSTPEDRRAKAFGWDPDWGGPGTGTSAPRDPNRVRPPLRWKSDNPFPPPPWSQSLDDYAPVKVARSEPSVPEEPEPAMVPWPPPTTEQEKP